MEKAKEQWNFSHFSVLIDRIKTLFGRDIICQKFHKMGYLRKTAFEILSGIIR